MSRPATPRPRRKSTALRGKPCAGLAGQDEPHAQRYYHLFILLCMDSAKAVSGLRCPAACLSANSPRKKVPASVDTSESSHPSRKAGTLQTPIPAPTQCAAHARNPRTIPPPFSLRRHSSSMPCPQHNAPTLMQCPPRRGAAPLRPIHADSLRRASSEPPSSRPTFVELHFRCRQLVAVSRYPYIQSR